MARRPSKGCASAATHRLGCNAREGVQGRVMAAEICQGAQLIVLLEVGEPQRRNRHTVAVGGAVSVGEGVVPAAAGAVGGGRGAVAVVDGRRV